MTEGPEQDILVLWAQLHKGTASSWQMSSKLKLFTREGADGERSCDPIQVHFSCWEDQIFMALYDGALSTSTWVAPH